jgi:predicted AlkP superfamily pyrophosphatase or phosphodiesterase
MRLLSRVLAVGAVLLLTACASMGAAPPAPKSRLTILVSIDGFRADYSGSRRHADPEGLGREGARGAMRPSFPSLTYPNHYTLITGKRPDRNGVVNNRWKTPTSPACQVQDVQRRGGQ